MAEKTTTKKGGKRPGAGRPKGTLASATLEAQAQREMMVKLLSPHVKELFDVLLNKGKQGDVAAIKELFDRAWGKSTQALVVEDKRMLILDEGDAGTV